MSGTLHLINYKKKEDFLDKEISNKMPLDIIQDVDELEKAEKSLSADGVKGTAVGYDSNTQISTFVTDTHLKFLRAIEDTLEMKVDKAGSYNIRIEQEGKVNQITTNGGSSSNITIKQGS